MARTLVLLFLVLVFLASSSPAVSSRKLPAGTKQETVMREEKKSKMPHLTKSTTLTALPKGGIPSSTPSKKGHSTIANHKLFARHLSAVYRFLRSVPSPGVGH